jgi:hypothetical protein
VLFAPGKINLQTSPENKSLPTNGRETNTKKYVLLPPGKTSEAD